MRELSRAAHWPLRLILLGAMVTMGWWALAEESLLSNHLKRQWPNTDFDKALVDLDEIFSGGPPKDGIPAIDEPKFVSVASASAWVDDQEPVIAVEVDGLARAYPIQILMFHEIVNDTVAGLPLSVTFCPLCNASIVFDRRVGDKVLDFGTTGRLRKSDLVMYDRQSESWWQQFNGTAIVGTYTGTVLQRYPASIVAFAEFRNAYADGEVLSRDTGHRRPYGSNPYRGYDTTTSRPFLFFDPMDSRLPPVEYVLNISIGDTHRLYPFSDFAEQPVINDMVAGQPVVVLSRDGTFSALDGGDIVGSRLIPSATAFHRRVNEQTLTFSLDDGRIVDDQTGSVWNLLGLAESGPLAGTRLNHVPSGVHFAFAWLAFNPDSEIYGR